MAKKTQIKEEIQESYTRMIEKLIFKNRFGKKIRDARILAVLSEELKFVKKPW